MMRSDETKRLMIETTKTFIRKNQNLTIKDIADTCFVNIAAVNYHFGSKDNLIGIATNEILDELRENIGLAMTDLNDDDLSSFEAYLERVVDAVVLFVINNPGAIMQIVTTLPSMIKFSHVFLEAIPNHKVCEFAKLINTDAKDKDLGIAAQINKEMFVTATIAPVIIRLIDDSSTVNPNLFSDETFRKTYAKAIVKGFEAVCQTLI
jgi:TetR/AcrR family transcriptional regulator, regulator of cefoperazone and chloramphenicol sensitivity